MFGERRPISVAVILSRFWTTLFLSKKWSKFLNPFWQKSQLLKISGKKFLFEHWGGFKFIGFSVYGEVMRRQAKPGRQSIVGAGDGWCPWRESNVKLHIIYIFWYPSCSQQGTWGPIDSSLSAQKTCSLIFKTRRTWSQVETLKNSMLIRLIPSTTGIASDLDHSWPE